MDRVGGGGTDGNTSYATPSREVARTDLALFPMISINYRGEISSRAQYKLQYYYLRLSLVQIGENQNRNNHKKLITNLTAAKI